MAEQGLTLRDDRLLRAAANGWSGEDMAAEYDITAAQAIVRVKDILASRDPWTQIEKKQLLLHSAYALKETIEAAIASVDVGSTDRSIKVVEAYIKLLKTVSEVLDKQSSITESELETITRSQARALMQLVVAGYNRARDLLAEEYPDVDLLILDEAFQVGMREATERDEDE